jgi:indoleamine 2,3-dioxygenase
LEYLHPFGDYLLMIMQWLPNQLGAVLTQMSETSEFCKSVNGVSDIMEIANQQRETLDKEVAKYCGERGVAAS